MRTSFYQDLDKRSNELSLINKILETNASDIQFKFLPSQYQANMMLEEQ